MNKEHVEVIRMLLSAPTVPFREEAVIERVKWWAALAGCSIRHDDAGNIFLHYRKGRADGRPKWVIAAHMDHPGFIVRKCRGRDVTADFLGVMGREYFKGARVRLFTPGGAVVATVQSAKPIARTPWLRCQATIEKRFDGAEVPAGTIGMWDLTPMRLSGRRLITRGCDDVVGCASVLCAMDEIISSGVDADVTALLTRAEEAGFVGALAACKLGSIDPDAFLVAIETSMAQPKAQLGDGVVIRVGDKSRIFDPSLTGHLATVAASIAKKDKAFKYTRQLMPGGTCESTVYAMMGYRAAGVCLPLANYHNQGPRGKVAAEQIDLADFESLVKLLVRLASDKGHPYRTDNQLRQRLEDILKHRGKYLEEEAL